MIHANADLQRVLGSHLRGLGCDVASADTEEQGLRMALADPPDLVLVDVAHDATTGQVVRTLRADQRTHDCRIVVAASADGYGEGELETDAVLRKPFTRRDVIRMLASLDRSGRSAS